MAANLGRHARREGMLGHHAQLVLNRLELADGPAELLALIRVLQRATEHVHQRAGDLRRGAASLQCFQIVAASHPLRVRDRGFAPFERGVQGEDARRCACMLDHKQQAHALMH